MPEYDVAYDVTQAAVRLVLDGTDNLDMTDRTTFEAVTVCLESLLMLGTKPARDVLREYLEQACYEELSDSIAGICNMHDVEFERVGPLLGRIIDEQYVV
jgi:hypothetical protein